MSLETEVQDLDKLRADVATAVEDYKNHPEGDGMELAASRAQMLATLRDLQAAYTEAKRALHARLGFENT